MRYSEAKAIVKQLHAAGFQKSRITPVYEKIWRMGGRALMTRITTTEIFNSPIPVDVLLGYHEDHAIARLSEGNDKLIEDLKSGIIEGLSPFIPRDMLKEIFYGKPDFGSFHTSNTAFMSYMEKIKPAFEKFQRDIEELIK